MLPLPLPLLLLAAVRALLKEGVKVGRQAGEQPVGRRGSSEMHFVD